MIPIINLGSFAPIMLGLMGVLMVVLRAGASQVFFDVVGRFQAKRLIKDAETQMTVFNALLLDSLGNVQEAGQAMGDVMDSYLDSILPSTIAIADATIELQKFVAEGENFEAIKEDVIELGASFGYTGDQALQAASKMAQLASVLGEGQVAVGSQLGFEFGLISGMETEKAMQRLVNLNQQIHFMTIGTENMTDAEEKGLHIRQNTLRVLDQLNTIENRSAATMEQVTFVMNQFASQAHLTGESMAFMAAQSALLIEAGEEQGKGGRAIRAVYARLGADTSGAATALQNLGIQTHNANGALKPLSDILGQLNEKWPEMDKGQQQNITQLIAGNRHYTRLIKLIEGYDRILQLQLEGEMALMPALDEVNIRLESNINRYREAEANLANYQARLGDALLPALASVTEKQAQFNHALAEVAEFSDVLTVGIFATGQAFKQIGGPLFNTFLMFQSLSVASNTLASVTRALQGEEIVLATAYGRGGQALVEYSQKLAQINTVRANEIKSVRDQYHEIEKITAVQAKANKETIKEQLIVQKGVKYKQQFTKASIQSLKDEINVEQLRSQRKLRTLKLRKSIDKERSKSELIIIKLREEIQKLEKAERRHNSTLMNSIEITKKAANENAKFRIEEAEREQMDLDKEGADIAKKSQALMGMFGAATAAGGAIMLLARNERDMQIGMGISTASIMILTAMQLKNTVATFASATANMFTLAPIKARIVEIGKETAIIGINTGASNANTGGILNNTSARLANLITIKQGNKALTTSQFLVKGLVRVATKAALVVGTLALAYKFIVKPIVNANKAIADSQKQFKGGILNTAEAMKKINNENYNIEAGEKLVAEQKKIIVDLANRQDEIAKSQRQSALDILATEEAVLNIKEKQLLANLDLNNNSNIDTLVADYNELRKITDSINMNIKTGGKGDFGKIDAGDFNLRTMFNKATFTRKDRQEVDNLYDSLERISNISPAYDSLVESLINGELGKSVEKVDIEAFINSFKSKPNDENSGDSEAQSWELATEALQKFSNAREELFYGMNANNLTGDLIKQVQQTGVENLIANTEVIMTNNFNGMTTRQVADEILAQISQGAGGLGININLNTV